MKVVLLDNIKGVGHIGDVKDVNDGYARNFLLPKSLAKPATQSALKDVDRLRQKREIKAKMDSENAQKLADSLKDASVEFTAKASSKGTLFDGIEAKDVAAKLAEVKGVRLSKDAIQMSEHIKTVGEHLITLKLTEEISVPLKVTVTALQ